MRDVKKFAVVLLLFIFLIGEISANDLEKYIPELETGIQDYFNLMEKYKDYDYEFIKSFKVFKKDFDNGKVIFRVFSAGDKNILAGAEFFTYDNDKPSVLISDKLIEQFSNKKTLFYTMLTHEIWHYYDYVRNTDYERLCEEDEFEYIMYQLDAYFIEGSFLKNIIKNEKVLISRFEDYLLKCFENNSMNSFTAVFMGIDYIIFDEVYAKRNEYSQEIISAEKYYTSMIQYGNELCEEYLIGKGDSDWERYYKLISLNTFNKYFFDAINRVEGNYNTFGELFEDFPDLERLNTEISEIINANFDFMRDYKTKSIESLSK